LLRNLRNLSQVLASQFEFEREAHTAIAAKQMLEAGIDLRPGQVVSYVVARADARNPNLRVRALPLVKGRARYDREWYINLLLESAEELFGLFGYTSERISSEKLAGIKQLEL